MVRSVRGTPKGWANLNSKRRKPKPTMVDYVQRNKKLSELGYSNYQEYLKSGDWYRVRRRKLKRNPTCLVCDKPASQVHHMRYDYRTLLGLDDMRLVSLCDGCHEGIEFTDGGDKRTLKAANKELRRLAAAAGRERWFSDMGKAKRARKKWDSAAKEKAKERQAAKQRHRS